MQNMITHPIATIVAAVILGVIALFLFRWEISVTGQGVAKLNRWTGTVYLCPVPARGQGGALNC